MEKRSLLIVLSIGLGKKKTALVVVVLDAPIRGRALFDDYEERNGDADHDALGDPDQKGREEGYEKHSQVVVVPIRQKNNLVNLYRVDHRVDDSRRNNDNRDLLQQRHHEIHRKKHKQPSNKPRELGLRSRQNIDRRPRAPTEHRQAVEEGPEKVCQT